VIDLCSDELFVFREIQTDHNWFNFLWKPENELGRGTLYTFPSSFSGTHRDLSQVELVDFGATRSYNSSFIDNWLRLLLSATQQDRGGCLHWSLKLGYLTGEENDVGPFPSLPFCEGFWLTG
jgi:aarF domain-containing kinase